MQLSQWASLAPSRPTRTPFLVFLLAWCCLATAVSCMADDKIQSLRDDTIDLFYHGFDNYMKYGYPEDELKPLSCGPLTRDREDEGHFELNDVLGNYSLTLVDSLSTLAILASSSTRPRNKRKPLVDFQNGIANLVDLYGDGSAEPSGAGKRARGFDLDSKVQVFETVIRGVGGLLSAHLFAIGELPINGYKPQLLNPGKSSDDKAPRIKWPNGFIYDGQLLRLAYDLANRLLPAFYTPTGLPYPRVNLRHGVPFYANSPLNQNAETGECPLNQPEATEVTETCSAGAGSLVLEFSVLSRLTGDMRFEQFAKRAFEAVWQRRSPVGLVGAGIDAETGQWVSPFTGIGAGIDSFFEYAMKSHILFSATHSNDMYDTVPTDQYFLSVWQVSHTFNKHHLFRGSQYQHPHYVQGDLNTGAVRALWIDSLSAYYPGLLALAGELEEAIETHLLYAALWTRYSALPERWNAASGVIDSGLRWWGGRPEFIESTWYLYRATQDPWYLHVGEMVIRDIRKRCFTTCGWAGLEDVRSGELKDRMESFFLGETAKYLFLLFEPTHPLNHLDAPWVFTTEGHPLILPKNARQAATPVASYDHVIPEVQTCPAPKPAPPFTISAVAARDDFFHAASLARLHLLPVLGFYPINDIESAYQDQTHDPTGGKTSKNLTYYPWTFPSAQMANDGFSSRMETRSTFDLSFPTLPNAMSGALTMKRVPDGVFVNSVSGLKLSMIKESDAVREHDGTLKISETFRIHTVSHMILGRDERVLIASDAIADLNPADPYFTRHRDLANIDLVLDIPASTDPHAQLATPDGVLGANATMVDRLLDQLSSALNQPVPLEKLLASAGSLKAGMLAPERPLLYASTATGVGAGPLPDVLDASVSGATPLQWTKIFLVEGDGCTANLAASVPKKHQILIIRRGGCTFAQKLQNIPSFAPSPSALQLVVFVSETENEGGEIVRPALDEMQLTPRGISRPNAIPVAMVDGGETTVAALKQATSIGMRRRYNFSSQGLRIMNLRVV